MHRLSQSTRDELRIYLNEHYIPEILEQHEDRCVSRICEAPEPIPYSMPAQAAGGSRPAGARPFAAKKSAFSKPVGRRETAARPELDDLLGMLDESFQQMLLRKIDEKGMKDSVCYKRAGVDRKLFSKIRSNPLYKPKKTTVIAFIMALELSYAEATEMLTKAGYSLSHSSKFDVIVEYFITRGRYSLHELNEALFEYDQNLV